MRAILAALALLAALTAAPAQSTYLMCGVPTPCRIWRGTATTTAQGGWSVSYPAGLYTTPPSVTAQAVSAGVGLSAAASATVTSRTAAGASGLVVVPATLQVGGLPVMPAGPGIAVDVVAVGY